MLSFLLISLMAYLCIGYLLHLVVFPENIPALSAYFQPGQEFVSKAENMKQTIVKHENGIVYCSSEIGPYAPGPPKHVHDNFDEYFEIANGELSVWLDGKIVKLKPGQRLHVPKGTPHKPFNETSETIRIKGTAAFPEKFAFGLTQVYGVMDSDPSFGKSPKTMFQMALFSANGFDSQLVDGPPVYIQKVMSFLLVPAARLFGYKSYYSQYDIRTRK